MKLYKKAFLVFIALCFFGCGINEKHNDSEFNENIESSYNDNQENRSTDSIKAIKASILRNKKYKRKKDDFFNDSTIVEETVNADQAKTIVEKTTETKSKNVSFVYIKKILKDCKIGETLTQDELSANHNIPKEAIKLVKSITKISSDEIEVKWHSTWLIEKMSDAKFKDGRLKVHFDENRMYTSGGAIGIKYNKKMYTDLIIIGRAARIPTVKGFYWQIGKE